jgi:hypothetical protein
MSRLIQNIVSDMSESSKGTFCSYGVRLDEKEFNFVANCAVSLRSRLI